MCGLKVSAIPAREFNYAADLLCLAEGCEVRFITNVDTAAGLVTNSTGRVVQIIYENGDVPMLLKGGHPESYCVIALFPDFQSFVSRSSPNERFYPFSEHKLVPVFRRRFSMDKIPENIRKLQAARLCYRGQLTVDLSSNLTAQRSRSDLEELHAICQSGF